MTNTIKPFCSAPFTGLNIRNDGTVRTCCSSMGQSNGIKNEQNVPYNVNQNDITDVWNSPELRNLRLAMLKNDQKAYQRHCAHCIKQEALGLGSIRQRHNNFYPTVPLPDAAGNLPNDSIKAFDIRFNTSCDQACVMCGPVNSSMWEKEIDRNADLWWGLPKQEWQHVKNQKYSNLSYSQLTGLVSQVEYLEIRGGEPLVDREVIKLLRFLVDRGYSEKIYLSIVTNTQNVSFDIVSLLAQFKGGLIRCSIDAVGKRNTYHRYHSNWTRIENGLEQLARIATDDWRDVNLWNSWRVVILPTLTVYNSFHWVDFWDWIDNFAYSKNLPCLVAINTVKGRPELYHTILPYSKRKKVVDELMNRRRQYKLHTLPNDLGNMNIEWYDKLIQTLSQPQDKDANQLQTAFIKWSQLIESLRGQSLYDYFPELKGSLYIE
jgi:MoaA/NifB/PqqE/SkfB family radical SAM enzyme